MSGRVRARKTAEAIPEDEGDRIAGAVLGVLQALRCEQLSQSPGAAEPVEWSAPPEATRPTRGWTQRPLGVPAMSSHRLTYDWHGAGRYLVFCSCGGFLDEAEDFAGACASADLHRVAVGAPVPSGRLLDLEKVLDRARHALADAAIFADRVGLAQVASIARGALLGLEGASEPIATLYRAAAVDREAAGGDEDAGYVR